MKLSTFVLSQRDHFIGALCGCISGDEKSYGLPNEKAIGK